MSLKPRPVNFESTWRDLKETVKEVVTLGHVKRTIWNDRFGDVYSLCVAYPQPLADKLYAETKRFLESHVLSILLTQVAGSQWVLAAARNVTDADLAAQSTTQSADGSGGSGSGRAMTPPFYVPNNAAPIKPLPPNLGPPIAATAQALLDAAAQVALFEQQPELGANAAGNMLQRYHTAWTEYSQGIEFLNYLYLYLNQQHIKKQKLTDADFVYGNPNGPDANTLEQMEIGDLGLDIWRQKMIYVLRDALVKHLLDAINADRVASSAGEQSVGTATAMGNSDDAALQIVTADGAQYSVAVVHGCIASLVAVQQYRKQTKLRMYAEFFETPLLEATGEFYRGEAAKLLQSCTVSEYMAEVLKRLDEEQRRSQRFLHCSSLPKVRKVCEDRMISDHLEFLHSECKEMVAQERRTDLRNMYTLLKPIADGLKQMLQALLEHIKAEGAMTIAAVKGEGMHMQFVESMLLVHGKYEALIADVFRNDPLFLSALDKACSSVINKRMSDKQPCRSAELVAKYCDTLLKRGKSTEAEIEAKLAASITIFKYIEDKDVYQKFYSKMLAKRLIHEMSQSMDAEEAMINRLKQACGYEFTNKLHRMFTDISVSLDLNNKFGAYLKATETEVKVNAAIKVVQAGAWPLGPTQAVVPFAVPQEFEKAINMFEKFYHVNFSGRKLTWLHHLCQGELKLGYLRRPYIVTMQTYQMAMLLLFESVDSMRCSEMQQALQLQPDTFQKHAQSLLEAKLLVIVGQEAAATTSATTAEAGGADASGSAAAAAATPAFVKLEGDMEIRLNLNYSNKRTKFRISAAVQKEAAQEVEHTMAAVDDDRKLYLQAAIVRIMKSRKLLKHNALIQEILSQSKVSFAPSISMIKKCIESLIDKQYIERTPTGDEYSYVA